MSTSKKNIWHTQPSRELFERFSQRTIGHLIGLDFAEAGDDFLSMRMPVDERTHQPAGLLHGGASAVLAETVGSVASNFVIDPDREVAVGTEINCSHLRGVRAGFVLGTCRPFRLGRTLHVWDIRITDERDQLICVSRLTVAIIKRPS